MLASALSFSLMSLAVKMVGRRLPSLEIVVARATVNLLSTYTMARLASVRPVLGHERRLLLLRGVLGCLALNCFFYSVTHLPLAEATVIQYTNPAFTVVFAAIFIGERATPRLVLGIAVSLLGTFLVVRPGASALAPFAVAVALCAALFSAAAYTVVRRLKTEHWLVVVLYLPLVAVPCTAPLAVYSFVQPTAGEWLWLLIVGLGTQLGQICLTRGLALETAGRATAVAYSQIIFSTCWGYLFFGELPDLLSVGGAVLIVGGVLFTR